MSMAKKERVEAALRGDEVDRVPVAAWMHFPFRDTDAEGLVKATLDFQREYDWDFIKLMFRGSFNLEDWGMVFGEYEKVEGYKLPVKYAINSKDDWKRLEILHPYKGSLGEMIRVVKLIDKQIKKDVFKLATVFCPFMLAHLLAGERIKIDLKENKDCIHAGLDIITESVIQFSTACLESGAEGIFFATKFASADFTEKEEYDEFGHKYNLKVLKAIENKSHFTMLHICGERIFFDEFIDYPVHAFNWDDRVTEPSLAQARRKTDKCLVGGINKMGVIKSGWPEDVEKEALDAIGAAGGNKFILAPGCVLPLDVPEKNIIALRRSVDRKNR